MSFFLPLKNKKVNNTHNPLNHSHENHSRIFRCEFRIGKKILMESVFIASLANIIKNRIETITYFSFLLCARNCSE